MFLRGFCVLEVDFKELTQTVLVHTHCLLQVTDYLLSDIAVDC